MRHALFTVALLALVLPATALGSGQDVIRDCSINQGLTRPYTRSELIYARDHLPADQQEYSSCQSIIERALQAASIPPSRKQTPTPPRRRHAASPSGGGRGPSSGAGHRHVHRTALRPVPGPATPSAADNHALDQARHFGAGAAVTLDGARIKPAGAAPSRSGLGALPGSLLAVLVALALAAVIGLVVGARRWLRDDVLARRA